MKLRKVQVLIIAAMRDELTFFRKSNHLIRPVTNLRNYHELSLSGKVTGILICGVGGQRAGPALEKALKLIRPEKVLIAGWSGCLRPEINIHDLVIVSGVSYWKSDPEKPHTFDDPLSRHLESILANQDVVYRTGRAVCTDIVVDKSDLKASLAEQHDADIVDMESYFLLEILNAEGIPSAMLRIITDSADESIGYDSQKIPGTRSKRLLYMARHPQVATAFYRLIRSLKESTDLLGAVLPAVTRRFHDRI